MQGKRTDRLNALIRNELAQAITTRLKDERLGFVTVTQVDISPDVKHCKVYVSVLGADKEIKSSLAALRHAEGFLKRDLASKLKLRFTPKLHFKLDDTAEEGIRLDNIFRKIHEEDQD